MTKRILITVVLCFLFAVPVYAQDGTPEVSSTEVSPEQVSEWQTAVAVDGLQMTLTAIAGTPTPEPVPTADTTTTEEVTDALDQSGLIIFTWQGLAAFVVVLITTGGGGVLVVIRAVRQNDVIKLAMEKLYLSAPPTTQEHIRLLVKTILEGAELADDVTDGVLPPEFQAQVAANKADIAALQAQMKAKEGDGK